MNKIKVRIVKDKSINLKINSQIFEQIKSKAVGSGHFIADYINLILLKHLNNAETNLEIQIDNPSNNKTKLMETQNDFT